MTMMTRGKLVHTYGMNILWGNDQMTYSWEEIINKEYSLNAAKIRYDLNNLLLWDRSKEMQHIFLEHFYKGGNNQREQKISWSGSFPFSFLRK